MKISTRLFFAFGVVVLLGILSSGLALFKMKTIHGNLEDIVKDNNVQIALAQEMSHSVSRVALALRKVLLLNDDKEFLEEQNRFLKEGEHYRQVSEKLSALPASEEDLARRAAVKAAAGKAWPLAVTMVELAVAHKDSAAIKALAEASSATAAWQAAIADTIALQENKNQARFDAALADYTLARQVQIACALGAALLALALSWRVVRSIAAQLGGEPAEVAALASAIADADLSRVIRVRPGDSASVVAAMARMQGALTRIVASVRDDAAGVANASAEIAQGNSDLSARTENQASMLEQTAAAMEQLGTTVGQNADNAAQANQLAMNASSVALQGGEAVGQVVETMKGINESSRRIADIIGVIDGIAFQTNILALNAAVEAARAGEQGRGFAVVASEVRSLAGRSAGAAREIRSLIQASVERVEEGTRQVNQAGATMSEVVGSIRRVTDLMGEINAASAEQNAGVSQVGQAVTQMDQATQQNAALVEQMAAAASSLKSQASDLVQVVAVFKLGPAPGQELPVPEPVPRHHLLAASECAA